MFNSAYSHQLPIFARMLSAERKDCQVPDMFCHHEEKILGELYFCRTSSQVYALVSVRLDAILFFWLLLSIG